VIDSGEAPRKAIVTTVGAKALIQRCQAHKARNVLEHLPREQHASVKRALRDPWATRDAKLAGRRQHSLAGSLQAKHPGAAASLRGGLNETLTAQQPGLTGALYRTLRSTKPIENLNGSIASYMRNVEQWRDGAMVLRWGASVLADAATRMRKLHGCAQMKSLMAALTQRDPDTAERAKRKAA
jgi:transposase-like protein